MRYQLNHNSLRGARPTNQDRIAVAERHNAVLLALADGLGGHNGGEIAAEMLTDIAVRAFQSVKQSQITRPSAFLALTILQAHNAILRRGKEIQPPVEPRTTCVLALVQDGYAYWAHVGDSRLYHFRDGQILTRTQDHTSVEQLRQDGLLTEDEMQDHPYKSRLLKCLGGPNRPTIALGEETKLARGDVLLLCSDGVWEGLKPEEMLRYVGYEDLDEGVEDMLMNVQRTMKDGCDNISAVAFRWEQDATAALPLQGNQPIQVDQERMWKDARQWMTETKVQQEKQQRRERQPGGRKGAIDSGIEEIEEFLKQLEPRRHGQS